MYPVTSLLLLLLAPPACPAAALPAAAALVAFYPLTNYVGSFGGNIVHPPDAPEPPRAAGAASYMVGPTGCEETCYEPDPTIYIANHLREPGSAWNEDRLLLKHGRSTVFFYLKLQRYGQVLTFRDNKNVTWPSSGDGLSLQLSTSSRLQLKPGKDGAALASVSGLTLSRWYHVGLLIDMWDRTVTLQVDDISSSGPLPAASVQKDYVVLGSGEAGTVCVMGLAVYEAELKADDISALREVTLNEFACVDPFCGCLLDMSPDYGPIAGGTRVTMHGRNFHFPQRPHLVLPTERFPGFVEAVAWGTDTVVFYTPAVNQTGPASVAVLENLDTRDFFLYKENPVFTGINPTVQIQSGGNNLTITGTNLDSTPEPKIILKERVRGVVTRSFVSEECIVLDFTSMICKAPNTLAGNDARRKRDLDDEDFEDDYISHVFEPVASDNSRGAEFEGTVFKDPEFERFPERPDIKTYYVGRDTHLNIKILNNIADKIRGQLEQILAVTIGEDLCPGVALTDNQVLCDLRNISHADDERDVVIQAGGTPYYLNAIIYKNPSGFERFLYLTPGPTGAYPTLVFAPVGIAALLAALFCLCKLVLTKCSLAIRRHVKRRRQRELQRAADTGNYIHPSIDNNNSQDVPIEGTVSVDNRNDHSKTLTEEKAAVPRYYGPRPGTPRRNVTPSALRRVHPSAEEDPGQGERPHGYVEVLPPNQDADKRGKYSGYCTHLPTANDAVQVPTSQQIIQEEEARWRRAQDEGYVPMRTPDVPADLFQPRFEKRKQTTTHDLFGSGAALSDRDGAVTPISVHSKLVFDFDDAVSQTETPPSVDLLCGGGEDEDGYLQPVQSEQPPDGEETNPRDRLNPQCANWVLQGNNYD